MTTHKRIRKVEGGEGVDTVVVGEELGKSGSKSANLRGDVSVQGTAQDVWLPQMNGLEGNTLQVKKKK